MGYIKIGRAKLLGAMALLVVVVASLSYFATNEFWRERTSNRIRLESIDKSFDSGRCESVVLDTHDR